MAGKELFEKKHSVKLGEITTEFNKKTNNAEQGVEVFTALLEEKVEQTKEWMISVAKKAAIKHEELIVACNKASKIEPDIKQFTEEGTKIPVYSEKVFKEKSEPFKKLESLSAALDKAITTGDVADFKELEKLIN